MDVEFLEQPVHVGVDGGVTQAEGFADFLERELFVVDHVIHRRQPASGYLGIRKTATRATRMPGL